MILYLIKAKIRITLDRRKWRKNNRHNNTLPINVFDHSVVSVGNYSYGDLNVMANGNRQHLKIGHFCSIASGVTFVLSADHPLEKISTFPFKTMCLGITDSEAVSKGDIIVGDDVWIGQNAVILSGVTIGQGAVIAAGAVVNKDVPPYAVVGGVPAKLIKYRFDQSIINKMIKIDYSKLDKEIIMEHLDELYAPVTEETSFDWMNQ